MENAFKMAVPLDVEIGLGKNWLEALKSGQWTSETSGAVVGLVFISVSTEEKSQFNLNENYKENHNNFNHYSFCSNYND